eukprot:COSAG02_NODE_708_length_18231_cov_53.208416_16_plen_98_part_00
MYATLKANTILPGTPSMAILYARIHVWHAATTARARRHRSARRARVRRRLACAFSPTLPDTYGVDDRSAEADDVETPQHECCAPTAPHARVLCADTQ